MINYRVYIHDNGVIGESLIQAYTGAEAADVYVRTILDNGISSPYKLSNRTLVHIDGRPYKLSNRTLVHIDGQKSQTMPGKVTFDRIGSMALSEIDSWKQRKKTGKNKLPEYQ